MKHKLLLLLTLLPILALTTITSVYAGIQCQDLQPGGCSCSVCCIDDGSCPSWFYGDWNGKVCGCGEGDPNLAPVRNHCGGAQLCFESEEKLQEYLESHGYCNSWYGSSYSAYDFTKALSGGKCRYQAIITPDKVCIMYRDGPEPNPQPAYCCNGNPDLWFPWGCVRDTIERWHNKC